MPEINIENMVAAITLDAKIDLASFVKKVSGIEYNPENFPGAIYRVRDPKVALLVFSSGKAICTGAKAETDVERALKRLLEKLLEADITISGTPTIKVQNMVASSAIGRKINLDQLAIECYNTEYEPEQFPGLVYRMDDPKVVLLIFRSGKMIITGAKNRADIEKAAEHACQMVVDYDAIIP